MDVNATTQTLINVLVIVVIPTLTKAAVDYLRLKIQGTRIEQAGQIVLDAVDQTNQIFADKLRESGDFTKENQKKALEMSAKAALERMNDRTIELLEKEFNSAEVWIISKIEAACKANNENKHFFELK